jgi:hypothetical protein
VKGEEEVKKKKKKRRRGDDLSLCQTFLDSTRTRHGSSLFVLADSPSLHAANAPKSHRPDKMR